MITAVNLTAVLWYVNYDHIINIGRSSDTSRLGKRRLNQISCADKVIYTQYLLFFCCYHHFKLYFTDMRKCIIALKMMAKRVTVKIVTDLNTIILGRIYNYDRYTICCFFRSITNWIYFLPQYAQAQYYHHVREQYKPFHGKLRNENPVASFRIHNNCLQKQRTS